MPPELPTPSAAARPAGPLRPDAPSGSTLAEVAAAAGAAVPAAADLRVSGVTMDSRAVQPGDLFAAVPGARVHGIRFLDAVTAAGAVALLTDDQGAADAAAAGSTLPAVVVPDPRAVLGQVAATVYGRPSEHLLTFGVTGTNGKTTTAFILDAGLRGAGLATGLLGTVRTAIGDHVVPAARTTPESPELQALLATALERGVRAVSLEVSSHALALHRLDGTRISVAGFSNLSQDHLDFHPTMDDYFATKAQLFTPRFTDRAVICTDDPDGEGWGERMAAASQVPTVRVGTALIRPAADADRCDWWADGIDLGPMSSTFSLRGPDGTRTPVTINLPGGFNVANAALAMAMLGEAGVSLADAARGIAGLPGVPGRMERVDERPGLLALVDYAHTPDAVETLLRAVRQVVSGRVIVVLGCGGDRDQGKRPLMGAAAARLADVVLVTDDNPRSEDPATIRAAVLAGTAQVPAGERADVTEVADRRAAIVAAVAAAEAGDAVVVAGKGHEQGQDVAGVVTPFDDRAELAAALRGAGADA